MEEHRHYFKPIIRRVRVRGLPPPAMFEMIAGYERCECGLTYGQMVARRMRDPLANARAAVAYMQRNPGVGRWRQ